MKSSAYWLFNVTTLSDIYDHQKLLKSPTEIIFSLPVIEGPHSQLAEKSSIVPQLVPQLEKSSVVFQSCSHDSVAGLSVGFAAWAELAVTLVKFAAWQVNARVRKERCIPRQCIYINVLCIFTHYTIISIYIPYVYIYNVCVCLCID